MSFNYGNKSRHRTRGRHFKLFSDELPRIEFDRASLEEYNNVENEKRRSEGRRRRTFRDANHDRFSLPSLGTPEWDRLSETEKVRPQSYSPFNPLNPDFARIHQKIKRRHTLKETKSNDWNGPEVKFRIHPDDSFDKQQYTNAWHEKVRKSKPEKDFDKVHKIENENDNIDKASTLNESLTKVVVDKPPVPKKKSLFRELLDASAKENTRMNRIKESLKFKEGNIYRHASVKPCIVSGISQLDEVSLGKTNVPEIISESNENSKPGILKHGVRIRQTNILKGSTKSEFPVKPRLIHQEDLPLYGQGGSNGIIPSSDEVRVSVYADTPLNRMNDMMFVPLPSTKPKDKQKRVNFDEHVDIKEKTAMSELVEVDDENGLKDEVESGKIYDSDKENATVEQKNKKVHIHRRANVRHSDIPKSLHKHNVTIKQRHVSGDKQKNYNYALVHKSKRNEHNINDDDNQDYIDSILLSSKPVDLKAKALRSKPIWKEARPAISEVLIHEPDHVDIIAVANSPIELTPSAKENNISRHEMHDPTPLSVLNIPVSKSLFNNQSPQRSPPRSPSRSPPKSPDIENISDFTTFFDDELNFDDLPEEIDRRMLGEDIIKAYRLWDRKRKAFPGGLRKIEAPADRHESIYPKQYGNIKTYKITNPTLDKQPLAYAPAHSKPSQSSVLMDWV